jgi:hypothetical protein
MNANDELQNHTSTDGYHKYTMGLVITDGAKALADKFKCYWFLDIVASYQKKLKGHEFQVWHLVKYGEYKATVICTDGNDKLLVKQHIPFTDFTANEATVWVGLDCILLPSEH